jgi:hypothetical protein
MNPSHGISMPSAFHIRASQPSIRHISAPLFHVKQTDFCGFDGGFLLE